MTFVAIDVETANADMATICQVGIAIFDKGMLVDEWKTYVDPEDRFDPVNVSIHGIDESTVCEAPVLPVVHEKLCQLLDDCVSVSHSHFDRVSLLRACDRYQLRYPNCSWLDSARVARRTWERFARRGYGLANVCDFLGYRFAHHDALEDAKAAGHILLASMKETGLELADLVERLGKPISRQSVRDSLELPDANPDGPLYGENVVFTGTLGIGRKEASVLAARLGCQVSKTVTKKTTLLVVGDQDIGRLAGHQKSQKHREAEELIKKGQSVRILRETDFREFMKLDG